ncbi:MAG: lysylphosphatidylglycerol synthase domain-containing protein [Acidimicrobiia bacterium]
MTWIRDTGEPVERRGTDIVRLVACGIGVVVTGMWAQTQSSINLNLFHVVNGLTDDLEGVAKVLYALGSIWAVLVVAVLLLAFRQLAAAWRVALAGVAAWGIAELLNEILGPHSLQGSGVQVRIGDGPAFPAANVAIAVALAAVLSPYVVRPLRRVLALVIVMVAFAAMYLGTAFPSDMLGGVFLGIGIAALVTSLVGAPPGRLSIHETQAALADLGLTATTVELAPLVVPRASAMTAALDDGTTVRVDAYGRDQRDSEIFARVWHRAAYREPGLTVFGTRLQQVEHVAYALMLAERVGINGPRVVTSGVGGADAALLVATPPTGTPIATIDASRLDDATLGALWEEVGQLHEAKISHGNLDLGRVLLTDEGTVALDEFSAAAVGGDEYWRNRDDASLLALTSQLVGNDRAIAAAIAARNTERIGALIPLLQPAALPGDISTDKHLGKTLKALRADVATATGAEDTPPLKVKRLSWANIGILAGVLFALAIAIPSLEGIDWSSVQSEFENATWGWALLALLLYPLVPMSWATALMGCVNQALAFVPTVLVQLACSFLNLITPNGIGGTALQLDYLSKQGVPIASGASAMVLSTGVGGAIQMVLFLGALTFTATSSSAYDLGGGGSASLWAIAIVAALIGIVLLVPKLRGKVVPAVTRAAKDIWAVLRNPRKALQLFGGDLAGNLVYPFLLGLCLLAFHSSLGFAELMVVQIGAGMLGNLAPVPGGIGVQEAALTAGLTSFGIDTNTALATVLVFRGITFALPPVFGFITLHILRNKGTV